MDGSDAPVVARVSPVTSMPIVVTLDVAADAGLAALFAALPAFERALDSVVRRAMRDRFDDGDAGIAPVAAAAAVAPAAAAQSSSSFPKWLRMCRSIVPAAKLEDTGEPWDAYAAVKIVKAKLEEVFLDVAGIRNEFAKPEAAEGLRVACETVIITRMWFAHSPSPNPAEVRNALQAMLVILERLSAGGDPVAHKQAMETVRQLIEMLQAAAPCTVPRDAYARFALDRFFVTRFEATLNPWLKENLGADRFLVQSDPKVHGEKENKK